MVYKFYFYTDNPNADYDTNYSDKNIKTELASFNDDAEAIMYAAETVADMRDEIDDFEDSADAEIYLDDIDYNDTTGFCFAITKNNNTRFVYGDVGVLEQFIPNTELYSEEDFEDLRENISSEEQPKLHLYRCEKCGSESYTSDSSLEQGCSFCKNKDVTFCKLDEKLVSYKDAVQFFDDNIDDDNDRSWQFLSKRNHYVDDVSDIPDEIDGQKILYRFSAGRNMNIDIYYDAYQDNIYIKLPKTTLSESFIIDDSKIIFRPEIRAFYPGKSDNDLKANQYVKINVEHPKLGKFTVSVGKYADKFKFDVRTDGQPWQNITPLTPEQKDFVDKHRDIFKYLFDRHGIEKIDVDENLTEDTIKQGNYWVNKGKEGTHGKFRTKKAADAQRKAMFAQGFKESLEEDFDDYDEIYDDIDSLIEQGGLFLKLLPDLQEDFQLHEELDPSEGKNIDDMPGFSYIVELMMDNANFSFFDITDVKVMKEDLEADPPYIDVKFIEKPDLANRYQEDKIRDWEAENYNGDSETAIFAGLTKELEKEQPKDPREYFIDCIEEDPESGKKYRITRTDVEISGKLDLIVDSDIPADTSSWPGSPAEYEDHIEEKDFKIEQTFHIEEIKD